MISERTPNGQVNIFSTPGERTQRDADLPEVPPAEGPEPEDPAYLQGQGRRRKGSRKNPLVIKPREAFHATTNKKPGDQQELFRLHEVLDLGPKGKKRKSSFL